MKNTIYLLLVILLLACGKKDRDKPDTDLVVTGRGLLLCNEGNFMFGNGSLSYFNIDKCEMHNQVFRTKNGFPAGDVVYSVKVFNGEGYLTVNNSGKIIVMRADNFLYQRTITGLTSPRYIEFLSPDKAYVTDLYDKSIAIINPLAGTVTGSIYTGKTTEQMVRLGNFVYVVNWSYQNSVQKINCQTDQVVDSLTVIYQPNSIVVDCNGKIWVLSDGGYQGMPGKTGAGLTQIDAGDLSIIREIPVGNADAVASRLTLNGTRDRLYYLVGGWSGLASGGVFTMSITDTVAPANALIEQGAKLFYGLAIDPVTSVIYVSDAVDFIQNGRLIRYSVNGSFIDAYQAGIIPGEMCFY